MTQPFIGVVSFFVAEFFNRIFFDFAVEKWLYL
jgi:hypothetical protein